MANRVGLFFGGTTGAMDGTLIAEGSPLATAALDTPIPVHYRVYDDVTLDDPREDTGGAVSFAEAYIPEGYEVSFDDVTYSRAVTGAVAVGANKPAYLKQTAELAPGSYDIGLVRPTAFTAGTRLAAPADLTATPGDTQVALAWTAVTGAAGHQARYRTAAVGETLAGEWGAWVDTMTSASHTFTGLTNGVEYDFEVTALDANGRGAAAAAAAIPAANEPPVFDTLSAGSVTDEGWSVTFAVSDPDSDPVEVRHLVTAAASTQPADATFDAETAVTSPVAITGRTAETTYRHWFQAKDSHDNRTTQYLDVTTEAAAATSYVDGYIVGQYSGSGEGYLFARQQGWPTYRADYSADALLITHVAESVTILYAGENIAPNTYVKFEVIGTTLKVYTSTNIAGPWTQIGSATSSLINVAGEWSAGQNMTEVDRGVV